jgi:hypothetical protein
VSVTLAAIADASRVSRLSPVSTNSVAYDANPA